MLLLNKNASFIKNIKRLYFADKSIKNYNEFYKNTNFRHNKKLRRVDETSGTCQYSTEIGFKSFKPFASTSSLPLSPPPLSQILSLVLPPPVPPWPSSPTPPTTDYFSCSSSSSISSSSSPTPTNLPSIFIILPSHLVVLTMHPSKYWR